MKSIASSLGRAILGTILCLVTMSSPGWGGGSDDEAPDAHQDNGPSYFGFVKDQSGKPVADAKVTAEIKGRGSVITRTNGAGIYKLPGFGKEVTPNNIVISCSKEGYKHTRSITRSAPSKTPLSAVEVLCTMQRITK
jgi:hypothetical protein